jgi:hypothetical protein
MTPTAQQVHILDLIENCQDNLLIEAGPGTGKTRMLRMIDNAVGGTYDILYLAFNKRIVEEAKAPDDDGSPKFHDTTEIRTINGAGHRAWGETASGRLTVDTKKTNNIFRTLIGTLSREQQNEAWTDYQLIKSSVDMAKALGYIPDGKYPRAKRLTTADEFFDSLEEKPSQLARDLIDQILLQSIKQAYAGAIDYNDQLYMPTLFGGSFQEYPLILVDEKQDFSPINDEMLRIYYEKGARIASVGDTWQSIYAFRGAVQGGMEKTKTALNCTVADLSVSFRCPSEIVKHQTRNPKLTWSREGGKVTSLNSLHLDDITDDSVVICRNNAPLFNLALRLLAHKRGVSITGTDIGAKIVNIMNKLGPQEMKQEQVVDAIERWRQDKLAVESTTANDTADCMRVFACFGKTLSEATGYAEFLFKQRGAITLTTGHKAKGLEWERVYHLDPFLIRVDKEEQEKNLSYVITTRSANELYEVETKDIVS